MALPMILSKDRKRKIRIFLLLTALFALFVYHTERAWHRETFGQLVFCAYTIENSVWDLDADTPVNFLNLLSKDKHYAELLVTYQDGSDFFHIERQLNSPWDRFFQKIKLISAAKFHTDITHGDDKTGEISLIRYNRNIYSYLYAILVLALIYFSLTYFYQMIAARNSLSQLNKQLDEKIKDRTADLANLAEKYRSLFENMSEGFALHEIITDDQGRAVDFRFLEMNAACERLAGIDRKKFIGRRVSTFTHESALIKPYGRVALTGQAAHFQEYSKTFKRWFEVFAYSPKRGQCAAVFTDITDRIRVEEALKASETWLRTLIRTIPDLIWFKDPKGVFLICNQRFERLFGTRAEDIIGKTDYDFVDRQKADFFRQNDQEAIKKAQPHINEEEVVFADDGHREILETIKTPVYANDGSLVGVLGIGRNITDRKLAADQLRESEEKLRLFIEHAPVALAMFDDQMRYISASRRWMTDYGLQDQDVIGQSHYDIFPEIPGRWKAAHRRGLAGEVVSADEDEFTRADGCVQWLHWVVRPWYRADHTVGGIVIFTADLTAQKLMEKEREKLQMQLHQAQKMESIGRLAGGIAHDFNNMLSVIIGHAELSMEKIPKDHAVYDSLREIFESGIRSADITGKLLAFARKQTIAPRVLDLNDAVEGMLQMLRRLIGEDVDLVWHPAANVRPIRIDPSQIDQILANLCINARDAIPDVGKITIETGVTVFDAQYCAENAGFKPGDVVMLAVSDNGCGMTPDVIERIFEPFYTTKEVGKGTGLGLSTVYGIIKQNHGFINVYSEPDVGTTIRIYFPALKTALAESVDSDAVAPDVRGHETILLVEDEQSILKMTRIMLERQGYAVVSANRPSEALRLAREHTGQIHLLLTDVVMPEMNGKDLALSLSEFLPNLRCLFMSGYTANVIAHHGVLDEGMPFIQKPFAAKDLAMKIRAVLNP